MKRISFNSHQSPSFDEEARIRQRHQSLLQDYLDLQKEFVSKKRKLKDANMKRDILLAEVRFLRLREAYLLKMQSLETEIDQKHRNFNVQAELSAKERIVHSANNEAVVNFKTGVSDTKQISERIERKELITEAIIRIPTKKPKNCLILNGKRGGKKKISVQDQVVLEA